MRRAEEEAEGLKNEADGYVVETLRALRDHLSNIETDIGRSILSIEKGLASLEGEAEVTGGDEVYYDDDPNASARAVPRRASLAADTMGGPMEIQGDDDWVDGTEVQETPRQDVPSRPARLR